MFLFLPVFHMKSEQNPFTFADWSFPNDEKDFGEE